MKKLAILVLLGCAIVTITDGTDEEEQMRLSLNFQSQKLSAKPSQEAPQLPASPPVRAIPRRSPPSRRQRASRLHNVIPTHLHDAKSKSVKTSQPLREGGISYRRRHRRKRPVQQPSLYEGDSNFKLLADSFATLRRHHFVHDDKEDFQEGRAEEVTDEVPSIAGVWQVNRVNKSVAAAEMKRQYFKFRSQLPGGTKESTQEEHSDDWIKTSSGSSFEQFSSSRSFTIDRISSNREATRTTLSSRQHQRSAGETTGFSQSGKLRGNLHSFLPSDLVLPFSAVPPVPEAATEETETSNTTDSVGPIARLVKERLATGSRNSYDSSILVDFLALIALTGSDRDVRSREAGKQHVRRRGGLTQRQINLTPIITDTASRATSKLEAPLLFSDIKELSTSSTTAPDTHTSESPDLDYPLDDIINNTTAGTPDNAGEFGPFSDGNDPSAGVSPPPLPPVLRASLYSYLLPRLMSLAPLTETIPGVPGLDYPIISTLPYTNFYCSNMPWPGFYADTEARCQAWHLCDLDGRQASFLCPNGTIFNQAFMVCDWWYNSDCQAAPYLYPLNERLFQGPELPPPTQQHRTLTAHVLDTLFI